MSTKNTLALATLVAALPAALLGFFLIASFLNQLDQLRGRGTMYVALYGTTLAACAAVVFLPVGVLIFGPKSPKRAKGGADASKSGTIAKAPPTSVDQPVVEDSLVDDEEHESKGKALSTGELEVVEATPSMEDLAAYDDEAVPPTGEVPVIEEEDFLFDEEPQPPKKKGK
ncbi:MAG TPA: hypothetical protein VGP63_02185 [Planctomycetaceae bacterium]|nr:hypothetical protein [Planctomycetaceae bacterium]